MSDTDIVARVLTLTETEGRALVYGLTDSELGDLAGSLELISSRLKTLSKLVKDEGLSRANAKGASKIDLGSWVGTVKPGTASYTYDNPFALREELLLICEKEGLSADMITKAFEVEISVQKRTLNDIAKRSAVAKEIIENHITEKRGNPSFEIEWNG